MTNIKSILITTLLITLIQSCSKFENEYDFRNYLRDKHPYSIVDDTKLGNGGTCIIYVNDTINQQQYIYLYSNTFMEERKFCINCKKN